MLSIAPQFGFAQTYTWPRAVPGDRLMAGMRSPSPSKTSGQAN